MTCSAEARYPSIHLECQSQARGLAIQMINETVAPTHRRATVYAAVQANSSWPLFIAPNVSVSRRKTFVRLAVTQTHVPTGSYN